MRLLFLAAALPAFAALTTHAASEPQLFIFKKLLIAESVPKVTALPATTGGDAHVVVEDVSVLAGPDFSAMVQPYLGKPMSLESANALAGEIKQFALKHDRLVNVILPYLTREDIAAAVLRLPIEDVTAGILRLAVVVNRYGDFPDIKGNHWFSSKLLREKLGVKPGDEISIARLDEAVNWANTNPFRRVQVFLFPLEARPEFTNLVVGVQERAPFRFIGSYDDSGNDVLGRHHYTGSLQFGNFLGRDHQVSYQYSTSDHQHIYQAHSLSYEVPLPWRHRVSLTASYLAVNPKLFGGVFNQTGRNANVDLRYTYPLRGGDNPIELFGGIDYKQSNNNLAYGGSNFGGLTDVFQVAVGGSLLRRDKQGAWAFGLNLNLSPGHFNSRNTDDAFRGIRPGVVFPIGRVGARAEYVYGNFSVQRLQNLEHGWQFISRGTAQLSSANLLGSEQISIGGATTVRGFDEHVMTGDAGFLFSNDLQTPAIRTPLKAFPKLQFPLETRFLAFYDAGHVRNAHRTPSDGRQFPLASAGFGARMSVGPMFNLTADYGWQISRLPPYYTKGNNRGHVKVVLAY